MPYLKVRMSQAPLSDKNAIYRLKKTIQKGPKIEEICSKLKWVLKAIKKLKKQPEIQEL